MTELNRHVFPSVGKEKMFHSDYPAMPLVD